MAPYANNYVIEVIFFVFVDVGPALIKGFMYDQGRKFCVLAQITWFCSIFLTISMYFSPEMLSFVSTFNMNLGFKH